MFQDVRFALRLLAKSPGFTAVAVLTIALAVGPNTAIFSMINAVLLRPMPYRDADRIVMLWENWKTRGFEQLPVSGPDFLDWKRESRSFEDMSPAFTIPEYGFNVTAEGEPERAQGGKAAAGFFGLLGVKPMLGREFLPEEDRPGGRPAVLLSRAFWQRRFGGRADILGRTIGLDGISYNVVGVLPLEVDSLTKVDLWIPIGADLAAQERGNHNYGILARLKPGVTVQQAQADMDGIAKALAERHPNTNTGIGAVVLALNTVAAGPGPVRQALMVLFAAVALLLLIACANVAGLLLARGAARQKEIAVRTAVGAGFTRVMRQLVTESVLLAVMGGGLGLLLATWCIGAIRGFVPDLLPRLQQMNVDMRVLAFTLGLSVLTGILFGLAPALRASRINLNETLKEGGGRASVGSGSQRLRSVLLAGEVALSIVLAASAALMVRSFLRVLAVNPGFHADQALTMNLTLNVSKYSEARKRADFTDAIIRQVQAIPGVRSAAAVNVLPMRGRILDLRISSITFQLEGQPPSRRGFEPTADFRDITPGFTQALGIPLRRGRVFDRHDTADSKRVALINETLARRYFPQQDPLGKRFLVDGSAPREIVGVIADVRMSGLERNLEPAIYVPFEQNTPSNFSLIVRTASAAESFGPAVRRAILAIDPEQPVADLRTMNQVVNDSVVVRRLSTWMLGVFAGLALLLASVGIYGLVSYSVTQHTREIGLRMALGASPADVLRDVVRGAVVVSLIGAAIGLPASFALARLIRGLLYGIEATDPWAFAGAALVLALVAALAAYIPARRALRIDPTVALRYE
jgi:putative ABC transport system permease protein